MRSAGSDLQERGEGLKHCRGCHSATLGQVAFPTLLTTLVGCRTLRRRFLVFTYCIGFAWQSFGTGGDIGVASVRSCQEFPVSDRANASSKMDLLLAKAEPISDGGSASGITYLRG